MSRFQRIRRKIREVIRLAITHQHVEVFREVEPWGERWVVIGGAS